MATGLIKDNTSSERYLDEPSLGADDTLDTRRRELQGGHLLIGRLRVQARQNGPRLLTLQRWIELQCYDRENFKNRVTLNNYPNFECVGIVHSESIKDLLGAYAEEHFLYVGSCV